MLEKAVKQILARRVGKPEDVSVSQHFHDPKLMCIMMQTAEAYLFLMKCGFITGQTIKVDGGQLLTPQII